MKQVTIIVRPFVAEAVLRAVAAIDVAACIVQGARGYSRQKGYLDRYAGSEYSHVFLPKVEISVWVDNDRADEMTESVVKAARTGRIGDGKVLIVDSPCPGPLDFENGMDF